MADASTSLTIFFIVTYFTGSFTSVSVTGASNHQQGSVEQVVVLVPCFHHSVLKSPTRFYSAMAALTRNYSCIHIWTQLR